jgi:hypothetical protein
MKLHSKWRNICELLDNYKQGIKYALVILLTVLITGINSDSRKMEGSLNWMGNEGNLIENSLAQNKSEISNVHREAVPFASGQSIRVEHQPGKRDQTELVGGGLDETSSNNFYIQSVMKGTKWDEDLFQQTPQRTVNQRSSGGYLAGVHSGSFWGSLNSDETAPGSAGYTIPSFASSSGSFPGFSGGSSSGSSLVDLSSSVPGSNLPRDENYNCVPVPNDDPNPTPEPSTLILIAIGFLILVRPVYRTTRGN